MKAQPAPPVKMPRTAHFAEGRANARQDHVTEQIRSSLESFLVSKGMKGADAMVGRDK